MAMSGNNSPGTRDALYAELRDDVEKFVFDEQVAAVFGDMIRRSVPGYATAISMTGVIAGRYAKAGSRVYDLGCSLGATTLAMRHHIGSAGSTIVAVDNSEAMIEACRENLAAGQPGGADVELVCDDIRGVEIRNASVVVLNFTLQFIPEEERADLLHTIFEGMLPGGVLVLSEKIAFDDPHQGRIFEELHHDFKRANGYSDLEISQKRSALENVLVPESIEKHLQRVEQAGFKPGYPWFQCLNFASFIGWKKG